MRTWCLVVGLAVVTVGCSSVASSSRLAAVPGWVEQSDWVEPFDRAGVEGTFAVREVGTSVTQVVDLDRASTQFLPASTFKILNSLVILETETAESVDELVEWDGVDRNVEVWNRDHSLRSGIEVSAVWLFQEHARSIGSDRMAEHVAAAEYGNGSIGGEIDRFWLDGELRISALEQLDFLERLMTDELPFAAEHQGAVRDILVREAGDGWQWLHKTGTALAAEPTLGWLVGATVHDERTWVFALNLDLERVDEAGLRSQIDPQARLAIARALLVDAGALPG